MKRTVRKRLVLQNLTLAFDPVEVPRFLREQQGLPLPMRPDLDGDGDSEPIDPPVLWGFMPLEQGWFQLPIPNLTEQLYLDSGLARPLPDEAAGDSLIQGGGCAGQRHSRSAGGELSPRTALESGPHQCRIHPREPGS